jgi:1-acyl-sn-glycerol-3-phosphate acyltransferase
MDKMFWIEFFWGYWLGQAGIRLFGMKVHLEDEYVWGRRPAVVLVRHASITDTFIPLIFACALHKQRLRYVMKRELEWDPCLDLAVNRLPHLFVVRGSRDSEKEVEAIGKLMDGVRNDGGVIIFPEGTRYTPSKRERILRKLAELDQEDVLEWAQRYRHVLPPRTAGPLALFRRAEETNADIVFCAHTGLEKSSSFTDSFNGSLVGTDVHIRFWAVPASDLPGDDEGRKTWLFEQWQKVDEYIEAHRPGTAG